MDGRTDDSSSQPTTTCLLQHRRFSFHFLDGSHMSLNCRNFFSRPPMAGKFSCELWQRLRINELLNSSSNYPQILVLFLAKKSLQLLTYVIALPPDWREKNPRWGRVSLLQLDHTVASSPFWSGNECRTRRKYAVQECATNPERRNEYVNNGLFIINRLVVVIAKSVLIRVWPGRTVLRLHSYPTIDQGRFPD